ncbi:MAG: hypothetical protein ACRD5E_07995 [Nitrososphaeraceae archaeon]
MNLTPFLRIVTTGIDISESLIPGINCYFVYNVPEKLEVEILVTLEFSKLRLPSPRNKTSNPVISIHL